VIFLGLLMRVLRWMGLASYPTEPMPLPRHLWPKLPPLPLDVRIESRIPEDADWGL